MDMSSNTIWNSLKLLPSVPHGYFNMTYTVPEENEATVIGDNPCRWEISPPLSVVGGGFSIMFRALHLR